MKGYYKVGGILVQDLLALLKIMNFAELMGFSFVCDYSVLYNEDPC